jgi:hypothetical protein
MKHELFEGMFISPPCHEAAGFSAGARLAYSDCPPIFILNRYHWTPFCRIGQSAQGFIADYPILC